MCMSPAVSRSSVLQRIKPNDALKIWDRTIFKLQSGTARYSNDSCPCRIVALFGEDPENEELYQVGEITKVL